MLEGHGDPFPVANAGRTHRTKENQLFKREEYLTPKPSRFIKLNLASTPPTDLTGDDDKFENLDEESEGHFSGNLPAFDGGEEEDVELLSQVVQIGKVVVDNDLLGSMVVCLQQKSIKVGKETIVFQIYMIHTTTRPYCYFNCSKYATASKLGNIGDICLKQTFYSET